MCRQNPELYDKLRVVQEPKVFKLPSNSSHLHEISSCFSCAFWLGAPDWWVEILVWPCLWIMHASDWADYCLCNSWPRANDRWIIAVAEILSAGVVDDDDHMRGLSCMSNNALWAWGWWGVYRPQCCELSSSMWRIGKYTTVVKFCVPWKNLVRVELPLFKFTLWHAVAEFPRWLCSAPELK